MDSGNPFLTRRVRPGALAYRFPPGVGVDDLIVKLRVARWQGEIVGPHGSGKSTLLETLAGPLRTAGREVLRITLHEGQETLPLPVGADEKWHDSTLVVIDGYEQLGLVSRYWLHSACQAHQAGLLVTTHSTAGLPELWRTGVTVDLAQQLIDELVAGCEFPISRAAIERLLAQHQGNLRDVLFALYDLYERQRTRGS